MSRAKHPLCDCCEQPSIFLHDMDGIAVVLTESAQPTPAEIHAAPRRPARWCPSCKRGLERWQYQAGNRASRRAHFARLAEPRPPRSRLSFSLPSSTGAP